MATPNDVRESFPSTENGSGAGVPLTSVQPGSASAGVNGAVGFAFKDSNGNVVLPALDSSGRLPVTLDSVSTPSRASGRVAGAVGASGATDYSNFQTVLTIPAVASTNYTSFAGRVSCRKGALMELYYSDAGGSLVVLDSAVLDSGQYTSEIGLGPNEDYFSVPASASTPVFGIRGVNFNTASDLRASLSVSPF